MCASPILKLDRNGYAPSIMETENGTCYRCRRQRETVRHEIYFGIGNRKLAKASGLWVDLCVPCHSAIHANKDSDEALKKNGYETFTKEHSPEEFYRLFRRYY